MNSTNASIRWGWLKLMYVCTILGAGLIGVGIVFAPNTVISMFGWPSQDPIVLGVVGCVYIAFGLLSILSLRYPLKFVSALLLQLFYKLIWFLGVALPFVLNGQLTLMDTFLLQYF